MIKADNENLEKTTFEDDITDLIIKYGDVLFGVKNIFVSYKETIAIIKLKITNCNKQLKDI